MRQINALDVLVSVFAALVGAYSIGNAIGIWRVRNGGIFVRALCVKLMAFGAWSMSILATTLYQWRMEIPVSSIVQPMTDIDRLILIVPQAVILGIVLPRARGAK